MGPVATCCRAHLLLGAAVGSGIHRRAAQPPGSQHLEELVRQIRRQQAGDLRLVVGRRDLDQIDADDRQSSQPSYERDDLAARQARDLRRAGARRIGGIDGVDVERDVDGTLDDTPQQRQGLLDAELVELVGGEQVEARVAGFLDDLAEIEPRMPTWMELGSEISPSSAAMRKTVPW